MSSSMSRRDFIRTGATASAAFTLGASLVGPYAYAQGEKPKRVVLLGFDGVEPSIIDKLMAAGELPHLRALKEEGTYSRLHSTIPPQSPVAWTSFATCKNPGGHGIYDFIRRTPSNYLPGVGTGSVSHARLAETGMLDKPAKAVGYRVGVPFWKVADDHSLRCKVLNIPFVFPPDELAHGVMLCGLGVPDIRGTTSMFVSFSDSFTPEQLDEDVSGGMRLKLDFTGDAAKVMVPGARDPREKRATYIETPVTVKADREAHRLSIEASGARIDLEQGEWSDWVEWTFPVNEHFQVRAISRFNAIEVGEQVRLYMTCLQFHPRDPYIPFTHPVDFSKELADRYGLYKTIGWAYDTHALRQDAITEDMFLEDVVKTMAWREALTLDELERGSFDILLSAWTATDRVGHMFWRFRDPQHPMHDEALAGKYREALEDTYRKADEIVGKVRTRLREGDLLMVMSDHGFHTSRRVFNVNTWLVRNGYLSVIGQQDPATAYTDKRFLLGFDWGKSKAYSLGLSSIYLNLKGREGKGTVDPAEAPALRAEIREKLLAFTDPDTGDKVFNAVYTRDDYKGEAMDDAPDLVLGYSEIYQSTKQAAIGAAPKDLLEPNMDKWSGDHVGSDVAITPGMLFANQALDMETPDIRDLGVTALAYLGVTAPHDYEGKSLI